MRGWGITCLVLGIGSFVLPMMGVQFIVMELFGEYLPFAAIGMTVLGAGLIGGSFFTGGNSSV